MLKRMIALVAVVSMLMFNGISIMAVDQPETIDQPVETEPVTSTDSATQPEESDTTTEEVVEDNEVEPATEPEARAALATEPEQSITDYASLKAAIENPDRDTTIEVPGGTYLMDGTITVSKDLILKNKPGEKVVFQLLAQTETVPVNQPSDFDTFFDVLSGTTTFAGESNDSLVFNGLLKESEYHDLSSVIVEANSVDGTDVWRFDHGVFATVESGATLVGEAFTMQNLSLAGKKSGAVYIKPGGTFIMNGGRIHHNQSLFHESSYHTPTGSPSDLNGHYHLTAGVANYAGTFTMNGGSIDHNYSAFLGASAAYVGIGMSNKNRAKIEVNGGSISNNTSANWEHLSSAGGAISSVMLSDVIVNGGTFANNLASTGGAIFSSWTTTTTINGGTFQNNKATTGGGAISSADNFVVRKAEGETNPYASDKQVDDFNENYYSIYAPGFNYDINAYYKATYGAYTTINGGLFINNEANYGGAIYLAANGEINAGEFKQNKADTYGGAVYLSTQPYTLTVRNAFFTKNVASDTNVTSMNLPDHLPSAFHTGSGGAIWYCPTGEGVFSVSNGAALSGNTAETEGQDFTKMQTHQDEKYKVSVSNRMLGGGYVAYYDDLKDQRASDSTEERTNLQNISENMMLKSSTSERAFTAARSLATTIFEGNLSKRGGGLATNGIVNFGDSNQEFDLKVSGEYIEGVDKKEAIKAEIYVIDGDKRLLVDEVELNKDNNFETTLKALPLQAKNAAIQYEVVLNSEKYSATYQVALHNEPLVAGNSFDTKDLINQDIAHVHMILSPIPEEEPVTPSEPEKPTKQETKVVKRNPKTSLAVSVGLLVSLGLISAIGYVILRKKQA